MNCTAEINLAKLSAQDQAGIDRATSKISPAWPLDRSIAMNPLWQMRDLPIEDVSAQLSAVANVSCLMPIDYYLGLFEQKKISVASLQKAALQRGLDMEPRRLIAFLSVSVPPVQTFQSIANLVDSRRSKRLISWHDEIIFQISQFCASHFQKWGCSQASQSGSLYQAWLRVVSVDRGLAVLMGEPNLSRLFKMLPPDLDALLALSVSELKLEGSTIESYAHALLLDMNGWASWIAYLNFQSPESAKSQKNVREILGIRLAWELVIWRLYRDQPKVGLEDLWKSQKQLLPRLTESWKKSQLPLWIWSSAMEIEYQTELHGKLSRPRPSQRQEPYLQAVFCIDVRSEPIRRALESQDESIQTLGFAGFFGLPISFDPSGTQISRPQVPGLIKPSLSAVERDPEGEGRRSIKRKGLWDSWAKAAPSSFFMVEATGALYLGRLLKRSFFASHTPHPIDRLSHRKEWILRKDGVELTDREKAKIAGNILRLSGLQTTAPRVLLVAHGSQTCNNPQSAALECGACGGHTGEVNVRILANMLNDPEIRALLVHEGLNLNPSTRFLAALHNTTTDELSILDGESDPCIDQWLESASDLARRERFASLIGENVLRR